MLREEEERRAQIALERAQLEEEERREAAEAEKDEAIRMTLDFQRNLPEVCQLAMHLGSGQFDWIQDDKDKFRVFYKDSHGKLQFFLAKRIPERPLPYFEMKAVFKILPPHCTLAVYVGEQFNCDTRNSWTVCQLDLSVYRSMISSRLLKTPSDSWRPCKPEVEELDYECCKEARFTMNTHVTLWGCNKQAFQVAIGGVESHKNPFFDHKRLILGQQFLEDYLVGLDFLD